MPITYRIDKERKIVFTTATGVLTEEELLNHKKQMVADPAFGPGMVELSDVRHISGLEVTPKGVRSFVAQDAIDAKQLDGYKLAIVVSEELVFGMGRMYQMMTSQHVPNVRIFRDLEEAKAWLSHFES